MERSLGWSGLLIEADRKAYSRLLKRNRKAYTAPVCLSTKPYPMQVGPYKFRITLHYFDNTFPPFSGDFFRSSIMALSQLGVLLLEKRNGMI